MDNLSIYIYIYIHIIDMYIVWGLQHLPPVVEVHGLLGLQRLL